MGLVRTLFVGVWRQVVGCFRKGLGLEFDGWIRIVLYRSWMMKRCDKMRVYGYKFR